MALLVDTKKARDNLNQYENLETKMNSIESQTLAWMAEAQALYGKVDNADQATILALRTLLVNKLTAAVAI